jgi:hypothetical protein
LRFIISLETNINKNIGDWRLSTEEEEGEEEEREGQKRKI